MRFIPAPAGNTALGMPGTQATPVHPRACGEHSHGAPRQRRQSGSSPRLRGTQAPGRRRPVRIRFIPAPAGNTRCLQSPASTPAVHPRACGEHIS
ncbi:hypothetical protein HMPREF0731_3080 [Pseudoroseomonas cervicalis ATCC 49957]|nr:hypothetical protein HMPREF0731_3080 [Pseudoroseomonas cervicalis ATCC 49957]